jgi:hypothetical protein
MYYQIRNQQNTNQNRSKQIKNKAKQTVSEKDLLMIMRGWTILFDPFKKARQGKASKKRDKVCMNCLNTFGCMRMKLMERTEVR